MSLPKYFDFFGPAMERLYNEQIMDIKPLRIEIANMLNITEADREIMLPSGKKATYLNRIMWALTYLKKAGLIGSPSRGKYSITPAGIAAYDKVGRNIDLQFLDQYPAFKDFKYGSSNSSEVSATTPPSQFDMINTPEDSMEKAYKEMNAMLTDDLLSAIMERSSNFFERLVVELLVKMGYGGAFEDAGRVIGKTNDEGIDGVIREDKLGFSSIYIQAKRWDPATTIGRPEIQKFVGALAGQAATKGLFITTAQFTKDANQYAQNRAYITKVVLVDGKMLAKLMIENGVGVSTVNTYDIKKLDSDYFSEDIE